MGEVVSFNNRKSEYSTTKEMLDSLTAFMDVNGINSDGITVEDGLIYLNDKKQAEELLTLFEQINE